MATITELNIYPIKSCAGIAVDEATLSATGLAVGGVKDRQWMLVDAAGAMMTMRDFPRMALIKPRLVDNALLLDAPGMAPLALPLAMPDAPPQAFTVWDDPVFGSDCGDAAASWFSQALDSACRLVRCHPDTLRPSSAKWVGELDAPNLFSDGYPLLLIGTATLAELNARLQAAGRAPIPMNRFRPNIVIDGIEADEEDYAESFTAGVAQLKPVKPCPRCPMPSVDQSTGTFGPDPMDILQTYRTKAQVDGAVCFGMNCVVTAGVGERVRVGQEMRVDLSF